MNKYLKIFTFLSASVFSGLSQASLVSYDFEYNGWWDAEGGGSLIGSLITDMNAVDDGFIDLGSELADWDWSWSGNPFVSAFSISSRDAAAGVDILGGIAGFFVDGTPNLPDFADGLDQGVFIGGDVGQFVIDLEFLFVEDNTVPFPFGGDVTFGDPASTTAFVDVGQPVAVPEPSSIALLACVIPGALLVARRRRKGADKAALNV